MKLTQYILLIFLVAFCSQASCQHYINYTTRDGLPSATLYTGIQDSNGFMLINSKDGLIRFDGNQFELFNINQGLPDNEILNSRMDQDAYIWLRLFWGKIGCYKDGMPRTKGPDIIIITPGNAIAIFTAVKNLVSGSRLELTNKPR